MTLARIDKGFRLEAKDDGVELDIYDVIGGGWFGGVSAQSVADALKPHKDAASITVNLNSPGGDAFDGITIYNVLKRHKANVVVNIDGLAASAASVIAMAGDEINMADNAMMMIHDAWTIAMGDGKELTHTAERLEKLDTQIAETYAKRTGGDVDTIKEQMDEETWFTASEALDDGFITHITESKRVAACVDARIFDKFTHAPDTLRQASQNPTAPGDTGAVNHEGDTQMSDKQMTPEAFAAAQPEAVKNWKAEAGVEVRNDELARVKALQDAFPDDAAFALDQAAKGHDVAKAKAEYADVLKARNDQLRAENDELKKKQDDLEDGENGLNLHAVDDDGDDKKSKYDGLSADDRIQAEWDDNVNDCQKVYGHIAGYRVARKRKLTA